ncbi:MAG: hypothetical protein IJ161_07390 [Bacteroidales bacterium]|nr:hypothetical protein [Bacteroidales bacterium]
MFPESDRLHDNYYSDLFYPFPDDVDENGEPCLSFTSPKRKGNPSLAKWDFYLKDDMLLPLENDKGKAMCVKFWRKGDFDRLLDHIGKKGFTEFIDVEECL